MLKTNSYRVAFACNIKFICNFFDKTLLNLCGIHFALRNIVSRNKHSTQKIFVIIIPTNLFRFDLWLTNVFDS